MRALLMLALAVPCGGTTYEGQAGPTTPTVEPATARSAPPPIPRIQEREASCRSTIPASTFQHAATALTNVRAAIGRLCTIELVGGTPLQWRVSCGSDDFFASGRHEFGEPTACEGGSNAFACLGHGLRSMIGHVEHIDVGVVGHVDMQLPRNQRLDCPELRNEGWAEAPWTRVRRDRETANERLAWCRAARAANAVREGLGEGPLRVAAVGASSGWLSRLLDPEAEGASCPEPTGEDDDPADGRCQAGRRVDLLVRLAAAPSPATTACSRENQTAAGALYCLEECAARPEQSQSGLSNPPAFFRASGTTATRPRAGWILARSGGAPGVELDVMLGRLGL